MRYKIFSDIIPIYTLSVHYFDNSRNVLNLNLNFIPETYLIVTTEFHQCCTSYACIYFQLQIVSIFYKYGNESYSNMWRQTVVSFLWFLFSYMCTGNVSNNRYTYLCVRFFDCNESTFDSVQPRLKCYPSCALIPLSDASHSEDPISYTRLTLPTMYPSARGRAYKKQLQPAKSTRIILDAAAANIQPKWNRKVASFQSHPVRICCLDNNKARCAPREQGKWLQRGPPGYWSDNEKIDLLATPSIHSIHIYTRRVTPAVCYMSCIRGRERDSSRGAPLLSTRTFGKLNPPPSAAARWLGKFSDIAEPRGDKFAGGSAQKVA